MASLQEYFNYEMGLRCGIPSVTMMGTVEDWQMLREKIERLLEFEVQDNPEGNVMEVWVGYLRKVCDGFVESAEHPDRAATVDFWDKVCPPLFSRMDAQHKHWRKETLFVVFRSDYMLKGIFSVPHVPHGTKPPRQCLCYQSAIPPSLNTIIRHETVVQ
ncbi:unnamed protein product [Ectocarpus fasciculatus]